MISCSHWGLFVGQRAIFRHDGIDYYECDEIQYPA